MLTPWESPCNEAAGREMFPRSLRPMGTAFLLRTLKLGQSFWLGYARAGPSSRPPLLFLQGVLRCWQDFSPLAEALAERWRLHGLDFRGHGRSSRRPGRYRVVDYVEDATAYLRRVCTRPAV